MTHISVPGLSCIMLGSELSVAGSNEKITSISTKTWISPVPIIKLRPILSFGDTLKAEYDIEERRKSKLSRH